MYRCHIALHVSSKPGVLIGPVMPFACWLICVFAALCMGCQDRLQTAASDDGAVSVTDAMGGESSGFSQVMAPRPFEFPRDHGPHSDYKTEWWYLTGNLRSDTGRHFGYQLTIFRIGLVPPHAAGARTSNWAAREIYMGHFAITDVQGNSFSAGERLARSALGLAGARAQPLAVWVENWRLDGGGDIFPLHVRAQDADRAIDLTLVSRKPMVLQGDHGYSPKSATPGNASYYYSYTRLAAEGSVRVAGKNYSVRGASWMDREWSTSALEKHQAGWDWFSLQFDDGTELMYYRLRLKHGGIDSASAGVWVDRDGIATRLDADDVHAVPVREWHSTATHVRYPVSWRIDVPSQELALTVDPLLDHQELQLTVRYWEGAVRTAGTRRGRPVSGFGYLELAGYASE